MKKSKFTSYISKEEGEILKKTAAIVIFIVILAIPLIMLGRTPVGRAMASLLGAAAGLIGAAAAQIERCNKVGYFNASKGCWAGIGAVVLGVFVIFGKYVFPLLMKNGSTSTLLKGAALATGDSEFKITIEIVQRVQADIDSSDIYDNMSPAEQDAFFKKCFARRAYAKGAEARKNQADSPETRAETQEAQEAAAEAETEAQEEAELTPEQNDNIDEALKDINVEPAPEPFPVEPIPV